MISLYERGVAVDQFILAEELKRRDQLNDVGGAVYLAELAAKIATAANIDVHARIVLEKALSRRLIKTASDIIEQAYKVSGDVLELINRAEQQLFSIGENWISGGIESLESLIGDVIEQSKRTHKKVATVSGLDTGFSDLNDCISGLQKGDLIVLAACPSVGQDGAGADLGAQRSRGCRSRSVNFQPENVQDAGGPAPAQHRYQGQFAQAAHWETAR